MSPHMKPRKAKNEQAMRTTISMPPAVFLAALKRQRALAHGTFSDYMQSLVRKDAIESESAMAA